MAVRRIGAGAGWLTTVSRMADYDAAKAVFVAIDDQETGWLAQENLGAALERYVPQPSRQHARRRRAQPN